MDLPNMTWGFREPNQGDTTLENELKQELMETTLNRSLQLCSEFDTKLVAVLPHTQCNALPGLIRTTQVKALQMIQLCPLKLG